ncbi:acyltransferase family protein, partial [Piscinibacter sakaiensis]|uniref:acyltransferase family protein n=1 Tax=Piscinibacter sakaiensis TaxID=1547922 RepID=UPI000B0CAA8B
MRPDDAAAVLRARPGHRPEIDGLRALAVLAVMGFHAGWPGFGGGYVGVDVFFVLSGYLITGLVHDELAAGRFSLAHFAERRARRIAPALLLVLLASTLAAAWLMTPRDLVAHAQAVLATLGLVPNLYFWRSADYFQPAAEFVPLLHAWSLGVEEQFYLLFPLALLALWRWAPRRLLPVFALAMLASLALASWAVEAYRGAAFYLLPTRAWELLLGGVAALVERSPRRARAGLADPAAAAAGTTPNPAAVPTAVAATGSGSGSG